MKPVRKGLGKGLGALIPEDEQFSMDHQSLGEVIELKLNEITPNAEQPRSMFDEEALEALAQSIKIHGVVQPILVQKSDKGYMIIAGERRWRAAKLAKLEAIPAIIKEMDKMKLAQVSLIENIQRENLSDIEEARAYQMLVDEYSLKQDEVADAVGKSRSYVANTLRLLKLDLSVQNMILEGKISGGHGRVLLRTEDNMEQVLWANRIIEHSMSVRELEKIIVKPDKKAKKAVTVDCEEQHQVSEFERVLKDYFGTKVQISHQNNKGKIQIEYYGLDEFDRIMNLLKK